MGLILIGLLTSVVLVSLNFEIISVLMPDHDLVEMSILGRGWAAGGGNEERGQLETKRTIVCFNCFGHMIAFHGKRVVFCGIECPGLTFRVALYRVLNL